MCEVLYTLLSFFFLKKEFHLDRRARPTDSVRSMEEPVKMADVDVLIVITLGTTHA